MELAVSISQLRADLWGRFRGRIADDSVTRSLYATDASPFEVVPTAVAVPRDEADVAALMEYCHEHAIPVVPRGAGTGLAGESLGRGIILDLSESFRAAPVVAGDAVTVEPGVTLAALNAALAPHGRRFAPDPASAATCTVGGMIATNASGGNAYRFGYTRDYVQTLRVVWDNGERGEIRNAESGGRSREFRIPNSELRIQEVRSQTAALLAQNRDAIAACRPATRFNRCGYALDDALTPAGLDLAKLIAGSEGTLAIVTRATLRTVPVPGAVGRAVLGFPTLDAALRAGLALRTADGVVGCDLLDPRQLAFARSATGSGGRPADGIGPVPPTIGAALVISLEADTDRAAAAAGRAAVDRVADGHRFLTLADPVCDPAGLDRVRAFREAAVNGLYALGPGPRPLAAIEDVAVPAEELPRFVAEVQKILRRAEFAGSFLVHVLTGQVHTRPFVDLADPADRAKLWAVAEEVHGLALTVGGTVSTQHGTGLARTPWVAKQYGPLMPVFRELKQIFDPRNILNPGKIIDPDPQLPAWPFRASPLGSRQWAVGGQPPEGKLARVPLLGTGSWPLATIQACNGCGDCRTRTVPSRMCPVFHATGQEAASPRAKVNLFRRVLEAADAGEQIASENVRAVADLCVNCKMCRLECRAGVDVPRLMLEAKALDHAEVGFERSDWALARVEMLAGLAGNFAFTTNALLGSRPIRWAIEKLFGLSRHRTLPKFTHRTFLRRAHRAGLSRLERGTGHRERKGISPPVPDPRSPVPTKLAYFVDVYANYNDPLIAEAAVAVLRFHGFEVHVPPRQKGSGMPALAAGDIVTAREIAAHNVRLLADLVRDGYTVVCSEPTAALALTHDYLDLSDDPDTRLVAGHTVELTGLLWQLHEAGRLHRGFRPLDLDLGHHVPCHMKALLGGRGGGVPAGPKLLGLIPGVRVRAIDKSCSGMAGVWGLKAANYETSLVAGRPMIDELTRPGIQFGSTECGPCRMQMQEGSGKRALHPVQYLALAYGLLPELDARLRRPLGTLVTD